MHPALYDERTKRNRTLAVVALACAGAAALLLANRPEVAVLLLAPLAFSPVFVQRVKWSSVLIFYLAVLMLVPVRAFALPMAVSFQLEPQRLILLFIVSLWASSLMVDRRTPSKSTGLELPVIALVLVAIFSLTANAEELATQGLLMSAVKAIAYLVGFVAAMFFAASAVEDTDDANRVVGALVILAGILSVGGLMERLTETNVFYKLDAVIPLLQRNPLFTLDQTLLWRGGGLRVFASTEHPIAFGAVLSVIAPLAVHATMTAKTRMTRFVYGTCGALIVLGALLTVSRTALLGLIVAFVVMVLTQPSHRPVIIAAAMALLVVVHMVFPGVLGALRSTLSPSYLIEKEFANPDGFGRGAAYQRIGDEVAERPLVGMGFNMLDPEKFFFTDNQYMKLLAEVGILGVLAFVWLLFSVIRRLWVAARRRAGPESSLFTALAASCLSFAMMSFGYDTLGFPQAAFLFFVIAGFGCALAEPETADAEASEPAIYAGEPSWMYQS